MTEPCISIRIGTVDPDYGAKMPGTLLYTSDAISLKDGYQTYTVSGIEGISLPDKVTWTVEFSAGSTAGLVLGGTDVAGSSLNDFWQKDATGWTLYQADNASENADFVATLKAVKSTAILRIYANDGAVYHRDRDIRLHGLRSKDARYPALHQ